MIVIVIVIVITQVIRIIVIGLLVQAQDRHRVAQRPEAHDGAHELRGVVAGLPEPFTYRLFVCYKYKYMYICIYVYRDTYIYIYIYVYMHVCVH